MAKKVECKRYRLVNNNFNLKQCNGSDCGLRTIANLMFAMVKSQRNKDMREGMMIETTLYPLFLLLYKQSYICVAIYAWSLSTISA